MSEIITVELKSDLERIYKITGDILNLLEEKNYEDYGKDIHDLIEMIKFRLEDIGGTLQKDIFNCDYIISKFKVEKHTQRPEITKNGFERY